MTGVVAQQVKAKTLVVNIPHQNVSLSLSASLAFRLPVNVRWAVDDGPRSCAPATWEVPK